MEKIISIEVHTVDENQMEVVRTLFHWFMLHPKALGLMCFKVDGKKYPIEELVRMWPA